MEIKITEREPGRNGMVLNTAHAHIPAEDYEFFADKLVHFANLISIHTIEIEVV